MRILISIAVLLYCSCGLAVAQDMSRLTNVRRVYIADLGKEEGSDLVREKLRVRLMKSERFAVVETPEGADAILTGVAGVQRSHHSSINTDPSTGNVSGSGGTSFAGLGVLRLIEVKTQETIWLFEYKRGFSFASASSRVADKTVERLLKDTKEADKKAGKTVSKQKDQ